MADQELPHRRHPCAECPWRHDTPPGKFATERYEALRSTVGTRGAEIAIGGPMFACHMSRDGAEDACAGWLAVAGYEHLTVRLAIAQGALPATVLDPAPGWPPLFATYDEMIAAQADPTEDTT